MSIRFVLIVTIASAGLWRAGTARGQGIAEDYGEAARRIIDATLADNAGYAKLEQLCYYVGHRLSGSAGLERAILWAVNTLTADGQENVHTEKVMVPKWVRGRESLTLVKPRTEPLVMLGLGGSVATPAGGITAQVLAVQDEAELEALGSAAAGKIVLFNNAMPPYDPANGSGYGTAVRFRGKGARLAAAQGALACLVRSVTATSLRSPHTGAMRYGDAVVKIPAAAVSVEDSIMLARLFARGTPATVNLKMEARDEGMVESANVVAELRGSVAPREVVVISGHLDSWDVGQGAHDDGGGVVIAMEALNVLRRLNLTPRRTIRVVLWTNEENGLGGARDYVQRHASELANHAAAIEADSGVFQPLGYSFDHTDEAQRKRGVEQLGQILTLLEPIGATRAKEGGSGADIGQMKSAGVPLLGFRVEGSRYFDFHHTHADTLDKIDPDDLSKCIASMAVVSYVLADMPGRLGEP